MHRSAEGREDGTGVNWLRVITGPRNARLIFNASGGDGFMRANELVVVLLFCGCPYFYPLLFHCLPSEQIGASFNLKLKMLVSTLPI